MEVGTARTATRRQEVDPFWFEGQPQGLGHGIYDPLQGQELVQGHVARHLFVVCNRCHPGQSRYRVGKGSKRATSSRPFQRRKG